MKNKEHCKTTYKGIFTCVSLRSGPTFFYGYVLSNHDFRKYAWSPSVPFEMEKIGEDFYCGSRFKVFTIALID